MPTKFRELEKMLEANGWILDRASGSHRIYKHPAHGMVVVPFHGANREIAPGTLRDILKKAGMGK